MRRIYCIILVVALTVPAISATGQSKLEYRDDFGEVSFNGSDGNIDWSETPWIEIGESDGPAAGQIRIGEENCANNKCLNIKGTGIFAIEQGATRAADLSSFTTAQLTYVVHLAPTLASTGVLHVDVRGNGSGWRSVKSYALVLGAGSYAGSINVLTYAGSDFQVRFRLVGLLSGDEVTVDRVSIIGEPVAPSTTSSTSTTSTSTPTTTSSSSTSTSTSSPTVPTIPPLTIPTTIPATTIPGISPPTSRNDSSDGSPGTTEPANQEDPGARDTTATTQETNDNPALPVAAGGPNSPQPPDPEIRRSGGLLMTDYDPGMYNSTGVEVLAVSLDADYSLAVEVFGQIKWWLAILALLVAGVTVSGMDQKKRFMLRSLTSGREGPVTR